MQKNNTLRNFIKYVSMNILGMIGFSVYVLADTFFIADKLGSLGLAALNIAIPAFSIMQALGLMLGIGGATKYSVYREQKNITAARKMFSDTLFVGLAVSTVLMISGIFFSNGIAAVLGADGEIIGDTSIYIKTFLSFAPVFITNNIFLAFVRNDGSPSISMIAMLTSSFSNVVLDYVFIFPFNLGMFGAAFATCVSALASFAVLLIYTVTKSETLKIKLTIPKISAIQNIIKLGLSSFITEISSAVVIIAFNLVIAEISGNTGIAAYGIIVNTALVVISIFTGIAQGIQPLISTAYAHSEKAVMKRTFIYALILEIIISLSVYAFVFVFSDGIISIFNSENNTELIPIAKTGFEIYFAGFFFAGFNIISAAYLSAKEMAVNAFLISIMRGLVLILPSVIIMALIFGMNGVWLSFVVAEMLTSVIAIICMTVRKNK
ncbi:MAG: MATE family efflux transporter [Clostridia bacterium]|nr:MATE family efflux transporter [Clostridia bacterium]